MKKLALLFSAITLGVICKAQLSPEITSWIQTPGQNGYAGIAANVQQVNYTSTDVFVTCTCIPGYDIGPWAGNPNIPANQNFCFKITRSPQKNNGTLIATSLGHVGVWTNGVSIFNARDAFSYNNQNVWHQDALPNEGASFDDCLGHPAPNGEYHHHVNPTCLYDDSTSLTHSPIIGYAFDGFPIYGAYAYSDTNGTGGITRMRTGYRLRNITTRTTLPDGSTASSAGPPVSGQYPLGKYLEDYEYVVGLGDLDEHNGRFCVTPEYPAGIYAYFVTIDADGTPLYPYTLGPTYYGTVSSGNTGPQSGHNTIPSNAVVYNPPLDVTETTLTNLFQVFPNPSNGNYIIHAVDVSEAYSAEVFDATGRSVAKDNYHGSRATFNISGLENGAYLLRITTESGQQFTTRISKVQ